MKNVLHIESVIRYYLCILYSETDKQIKSFFHEILKMFPYKQVFLIYFFYF